MSKSSARQSPQKNNLYTSIRKGGLRAAFLLAQNKLPYLTTDWNSDEVSNPANWLSDEE